MQLDAIHTLVKSDPHLLKILISAKRNYTHADMIFWVCLAFGNQRIQGCLRTRVDLPPTICNQALLVLHPSRTTSKNHL